jgi:hypothetical protein
VAFQDAVAAGDESAAGSSVVGKEGLKMTRARRVDSLRACVTAAVLLAAAAPALAGYALSFDGTNDYVTFGTAPSLGATTFTIECWFYRAGTGVTVSTGTGGVTAVPLLTKGRGEAEGSTVDMNYFMGIRGTDSVLCADYEEGTGQTSPGLNHPAAGVTPIRNNTWYHAAATFDGTKWQLFLNGNLEVEVTVGANRLPQNLSIQHAGLATAMNSTGVASGYFLGTIDEPRVWNRALTQTEIRDNMYLELTSGTGLIGRWGLDEGSGTTAANSVAGGVSGTLTNGPTWAASCPFALANSLKSGASNAYVTFGNPPALGLGQFTLEAWFRRDGTGTAISTGTGGITAVPLVTKGTAEADGSNVDMNYFLGIRSSDNVLAADFEEGAGGASPGLNHPIAGVTPIVTGQWYHAAATYDGTTWRLYLNGSLENQLAVGQPPQSASIQHAGLATSLKSTGATNGFFNGALDEVRIWDHERSPAEIAAAVNSQITTPTTGLVARWSLNEGAGSSVFGSAGTSITGAITGTGWSWDAPAPFNATPPSPPAAPTNLVATAVSYAEIDLSWTDASNNETGFEIERSSDGIGGTYSPLASVGAGVTAYADGDLDPLTEYCYRVRAVNGVGESAWAGPDCETTLTETAHALDFGGTDGYVTFGQAAALGLPEFTVETWFRRDGTGVTANTGTGGFYGVPLVTKGVGEAEGSTVDMNYFLGIHGTNSVVAADFEEGSGGASPGLNHPILGVTPVQNNTWYHAAVTYDGSSWRLYLNGMLENELYVGQPPQSASIQHAGLATAMNSTGVASGYFDGILDEVRIWNYARTLGEIRTTINEQLATPETGLIARWSLNEGAGTRVYGSAGTAVRGILTGTNWAWTAPGAPFDIVINDPPDEPVLVEPLDDAVAVALSPNLEVTVSDPESDTLSVSFYGRPVSTSSHAPFSLILLPDTQYYSSSQNGGSPVIYRAQTDWIVDSISTLNIGYACQIGDCVENGDTYPAQWDSAWSALGRLENPVTTGLPEGLPYGVTVGNHDQTPAGDPAGTTTGYNAFFGSAHFAGRAYYGGHYGANNDNHYELWSASGLDFITISLEYDSSPDAPVLAWAESLLVAYPQRWGVVCFHNIISTGNPGSFSTPGQAIYDALKDNANLVLMLGGHSPGEGRRSDTYNGRTVHTILADYQNRTNGGDGWLRIHTFYPDDGVLRTRTYSPTLDLYEADADSSSQFGLPIDIAANEEWQLIGTVTGVASGSSASVQWPGLSALTEYEWYVVVSDDESSNSGPTWSFTTRSLAPSVTVVAPNGGEVLNVDDPVSLQWTATDDVEVTAVDVLLSRDGVGGTYEPLASGLPNTGAWEWTVTAPGTEQAVLKVVAHDADENTAEDVSDSTFVIYEGVGVPDGAIVSFALDVRSGNPARGSVELSLAVPRECDVRAVVYDVLGREVAVLADGVFGPGMHTLAWDGSAAVGRAASGVYFVRVETPDGAFTRKVAVVR